MAEGRLHGKLIRRSLDIASWEGAQATVREWEALGSITGEAVTVEDAVKRYLADCDARNLKPATIDKQRLFLTRHFAPWCEGMGIRFIGAITVDDLRDFRQSWKGAPITALKRLERLRSFFRFCERWLRENPTKHLKPPKVPPKPTLPFTDEEMAQILAAVDKYPKKNSFGYDNRARLRAFVLLLRYSGLRITDATAFDFSKLDGNRVFLYQAKTGQPVFVPLPPIAVEALDALRPRGETPFWSGRGTIKSAVSHWQRVLGNLFKLAGVEDGYAHRFRDTFSVALLTKAVPIETVSILLGHASIAVTNRHYAPFVRARQVALEDAVRQTWAQ